MNMKSLIVTGVVPSIDELQKFQNRAADKLDGISTTIQKKKGGEGRSKISKVLECDL
jgi:hypothetical protein